MWIPCVFMLLMLAYSFQKNKSIATYSTMLCILYLAVFLVSNYLYAANLLRPTYNLNYLSMLYLSISISIIIFPICSIKYSSIKKIVFRKNYLFSCFHALSIVVSISMIVLSLLTYRELSHVVVFTASRGSSIISEAAKIPSLLRYPSSFILPMFPYFQFLFILELEKNKIKAFLYFLSSLAYPISVFVFAVGRDGFIFWTMAFISNMLLLKNFIQPKTIKQISFTLCGVITVMFSLFWMISVSRFAGRPQGLTFFLLSYAGQMLANFSDIFSIEFLKSAGAQNFLPIKSALANIGLFPKYDILNAKTITYSSIFSKGLEPWVFSTFIGSLLKDFNKYTLLSVLAVFQVPLLWLTLKINNNRLIYAEDFLLIQLIYNIVQFGVFYYRHYSFNAHIFFVICFVFIVKLLIFLRTPSSTRVFLTQ